MGNNPNDSIEEYQSGLAVSIINNELWLLTPRFIYIHDFDTKLLRQLEMKTSRGKLGLNPTACAQNKHATYVTFCRSRVNLREQSLNGVWTVDPTTGTMKHKLENGEYVNVSCTADTAVALNADLSKIFLCKKTGDQETDYTMTSFNLRSPCANRSLLTDGNRIMLVSNGAILTVYHSGAVVGWQELPKVDTSKLGSAPVWHLCGLDSRRQLLLCEQMSGGVYLRDSSDTYQRVHFGEVNSELECPVALLHDCYGSLWVHQHTIYGEMLVKFTIKRHN